MMNANAAEIAHSSNLQHLNLLISQKKHFKKSICSEMALNYAGAKTYQSSLEHKECY